jgi:hypothetical protein
MNSFISRNNDVYGYWGIGKLYSHMTATNSTTIEIDLISLEIKPTNNEFALLIKEYSNKMLKHLKKLNLDEGVIQKATIILNGYKNEPTLSLGQMAPNRINCKVSLVDDLNKKYTCETNTWCRKHNNLKESKSTRIYNESNDT